MTTAPPLSREALQLAQFELLLDQADPNSHRDLQRIEATLLRLLEHMAARRRPLPVRSDRERVDMRATLRQYLRQGEYLSGLVYRERPREKRLVVLIDQSESFGPFALWGAVVAVTARRLAPGAAIWGFGPAFRPLEAECGSLATFLAGQRAGPACYSLADLPAMLDQVGRETIGAARIEVWLITDLLLPPGAPSLPLTTIESAARAVQSFVRLRVLDPTSLYAAYEDGEGQVTITGRQLRELVSQAVTWRVAETAQRIVALDARTIAFLAEEYPDQAVFRARRATPWLKALQAHRRLASRLDVIARSPNCSSLYELFFGGVAL